jgi:anaerobic magnesium-protoporphyrin IX monomethyl ester cyclase
MLTPKVVKSRKILFVIPSHDGEVQDKIVHKYFRNSVVKYMPLGVLSLAACLKGNDVSILDASSKGMTLEETIQEIEIIKPDILALSVSTYRAWAMTEILKKTTALIKIVGGPHATYNSTKILEQGAHAVFVGDAEYTLPRWIDEGCPSGIFHGEPVNLNKIPLPNRNLVNLDDYRIVPNNDILFNAGDLRLPIFSSKGCPYKCIYCDVQQKAFNWKTPERVIEEFQTLIDMGATSIHILDDCFNIKKDRVLEICTLLLKGGIDVDWSVRGTVEINEDVIKSIAEAGCKRFHAGIEHFDDNVLKYFRKSHRYQHIEKFCELCNKYGINVLVYLIIGVPGETKKYRKNLPEMIKKLNITMPFINVLSPLCNTPYYEGLLKDGTLKKDYWDEFIANPVRDFVMPSGRSSSQDERLADTLNRYIEIFYKS